MLKMLLRSVDRTVKCTIPVEVVNYLFLLIQQILDKKSFNQKLKIINENKKIKNLHTHF